MYERELSVALAAARQAAAAVMDVYATEFAVDYKDRNDPVTEADRRANDLIVSALRAAFPSDEVCSEEGPIEQCLRAASRGGRSWFVDPLDGTREFVAKNGEFCVMVGLAIDGMAMLGVIVAPAWNRTIWGIVGQGAREIGVDGVERALHVAEAPADVRHARMVVSRSHRNRAINAVADALGVSDVRPCGSVGLKVALVASGEADLYVHAGSGPKLWDGCAPDAVARAAGAEVSNAFGEPLRYDRGRLALDEGIVVAAPPLRALAAKALAPHVRRASAP